MQKKLITLLRSVLNRIGIDIHRYRPPQKKEPIPEHILIRDINVRRHRILKRNNVSLVLDVGANRGQYAKQLRKSGYLGKIVSFEPLSNEFAQLALKSEADENWESINVALGNEDGTIEINIAGNSESSSVLPMLDRHLEAAPNSAYQDIDSVKITSLDKICSNLVGNDERIYMNIDVQGYEMPVLKGSLNILPRVFVIEIELSVVPLYEGQLLFPEMIDYLNSLGFSLVSVEPGFIDVKSGHVLQFDGIFERY